MHVSIMKWLIASVYICDEDKKIVQYDLGQGIYSVLGILINISVGYLLDVLIESILFLAAFISLRIYAGGYHASTRRRCAFFSFILMLAAMSWIRLWNLSKWQMLIVGIVEYISLFFIIPVDDTFNLEPVERKVYRSRGRTIILIQTLFFIITGNVLDGIYARPLVVASSAVLLLGGLEIFKHRTQKRQ